MTTINWDTVRGQLDDAVRKLRRPQLLREAIDTPVRQRTAFQAALIGCERAKQENGWK